MVAPVAGRVLRAGVSNLASARIALEVAALCDTLRRQAGPYGVRVAVVDSSLVALESGASGAAPSAPEAGAPLAPLQAEDVAATILFVLTQPLHVSINEILIRPTDQHV